MEKLAFVLVVLACVCAVALPQVAFADVQEDLQTEIENGVNRWDFFQME